MCTMPSIASPTLSSRVVIVVATLAGAIVIEIVLYSHGDNRSEGGGASLLR
jgi:hypothetical protein